MSSVFGCLVGLVLELDPSGCSAESFFVILVSTIGNLRPEEFCRQSSRTQSILY